MAFAVTQWPKSPDPRAPDFNLYGFNVGQLPPWTWILSTTNATGIWSIFNAGVVMRPTIELPEDTRFDNVDTLPDDITVIVSSKGQQLPVGPGAGITKSIGIILLEGLVDRWSGGKEWLYPDAIRVFGGIDMAEDSPSAGDVPDPMALTPSKWNVP